MVASLHIYISLIKFSLPPGLVLFGLVWSSLVSNSVSAACVIGKSRNPRAPNGYDEEIAYHSYMNPESLSVSGCPG